MKNLKTPIYLLLIIALSNQCTTKSDIPPQITAEQIKGLVGTTWEITNYSGEHKATLNGLRIDLTGMSYFNKFKFVDFLNETTLKSNGFSKKNMQYKISGNEIDIVDNERFLITIQGNTMTWYWTTEYYQKQIKNANYILESSDIKLTLQKK